MKRLIFPGSIVCSLLLLFCTSKKEQPQIDYGLTDTGKAFNPRAWYGKTRMELGKLLPQISNIQRDFSSGPFTLENQMDLRKITFTFENAEKDARLLHLHVNFKTPVTVTAAAKKFGVVLKGIVPNKQNKFWNYPLNKPLIHSFFVNLSSMDPDSATFNQAWIAYKLKQQF